MCQLDAKRQPVCRCSNVCPNVFSPVCGSDGKSYASECALQAEACRQRKSIRTLYDGECISGKIQFCGILDY